MNIPTPFFLMTVWMIGQGLPLVPLPTYHAIAPLPPSNNSIHSTAWLLKQTNDQGDLVSISDLLQHPEDYHQKIIRLRGTVTRLELHLDETNHFIDYVFFVKQEEHRVLVFGRHDRTKGDIQLTSDRMVEVQGIFWKERFANGHVLKNNLEAQAVWFYPSLLPDQAKRFIPDNNAQVFFVRYESMISAAAMTPDSGGNSFGAGKANTASNAPRHAPE